MTSIELLAPARNAMTAIEAVRHGADAVYMGASSHGARVSAANSVDDIRRVVEFAHTYRARVYVTLNTLIYDSELREVERLVRTLYEAGVDALIVQDMALLDLDIPPVALHASTQCDIRSVDKARFLADAGFSQLVLPREMSLDEISRIHRAVDVPLEAFVHGALCVCYSGDCQASLLTTGRSANRGECAQICRLPFDLIDGDGRCIKSRSHLLSLRDMNRSAQLVEMIEAGVTSFKIEGRLKDVSYVKETVAFYNNLLDRIVADNPGKYRRSSTGRSEIRFSPAPERAFNRGFTPYFLTGGAPGRGELATFATPKSIGTPVATVSVASRGSRLTVRMDEEVHNGDGLGYFDRDGSFAGFRVNRVDGSTIYAASAVSLPKGTVLYRNRDVERDRMLAADTAVRLVGVSMTLRRASDGVVAVDLEDERGCRISVAEAMDVTAARTPQADQHRRVLCKTGATAYRLDHLDDRMPDMFVAASALTSLRRRAFESLDQVARMTYRYDYRRSDLAGDYPVSSLTYHDNVANEAAGRFYARHGVSRMEPALETVSKTATPLRVMTTRYCLRRELGACLKQGGGNVVKGPLILRSQTRDFRLEFDCANCRMEVFAI